jgi:hypothetical protein
MTIDEYIKGFEERYVAIEDNMNDSDPSDVAPPAWLDLWDEFGSYSQLNSGKISSEDFGKVAAAVFGAHVVLGSFKSSSRIFSEINDRVHGNPVDGQVFAEDFPESRKA